MIFQLLDLTGICFPLLIYYWGKFRARATGLVLWRRLRESQSLDDLVLVVCFAESLIKPTLKI
jgi:hypothetical protein